MPTIQEKIEQARAAGYSDDDIAAKLAGMPGYADKLKTAADVGYSTSDILAHLSGKPAVKAQPAAASLADQIPGGGVAGNRNVGKPDDSTFMDKVTGGIESARTLLTGATTGALGYIGGTLGGLAGSIASGEFGTEQGVKRAHESAEEGMAKMTYQPKTDKGIEYTQNIAHALENTGVQGLPIGGDLMAAGALAKPAMRQAANAVSTEGYIAKNVAKNISDVPIVPTVDIDKAKLAQKAMDMGISIPPHALSDNSFLRMTGDFFDNLPFSGSNKEANRDAFNRYLIEQLGGDNQATRLTPQVFAEAQANAGKVIGDTFKALSIPADDAQLVDDLTGLLRAQGRELDPTKSIIEGNVQELARIAADNNGTIPGAALKKMHSEVLAKLRGNLDAHPGMREQLSDFQQILEDAADRQITDPAIRTAYDIARRQYAKSKTLEPLVAKGGIDGVSPQALLGRVTATSVGKHRMATGTAGELGEAAEVAQQFMKEQPSSRTAERGFLIGAATELAGAGKAVVGLTLGNIYNRFGPRMAKLMVDRSLAKGAPPKPFSKELALAEESPFAARSTTETPTEYNGLLTLADDSDPSSRIGGIPKDADPIKATRAQVSGVPDTERLATSHTAPTMDFPLRQEVLQQPEIAAAIDAFRGESERLTAIATNAINPVARKKATQELAALQDEFASGMKQLGIEDAADAHGLNRPLYETGVGTRMPVEKTMSAVDRNRDTLAANINTAHARQLRVNEAATAQSRQRLRAEVEKARQKGAMQSLSQAKTVDEALDAFHNTMSDE